ncbi:hypothetical protein IJG76_02255 [Candidatus Saccharibacteria bacterium]|nr:hypothetical protein [Candidatus Saccharibacteria bacterium]MBQ3318815.1 hypothetical protein [Candidatus Saccharibacteria bacterium]
MEAKYWIKQEKALFPETEWNLPEQKMGKIEVVGGSKGAFSNEIRIAEYIARELRFSDVEMCFPESVRANLPNLPNAIFGEATSNGSFSSFPKMKADYILFLGELTKNAETKKTLDNKIKDETTLFLLTRDAVDIVNPESYLDKENATVVASLVQVQKIFREVYYPKVITLSQPILPIVEAIHKFTLSYKITLVTFYEGLILVARDGKVVSTAISKTGYSPLSLWSGQLAAKIAMFQYFNPGKMLEATSFAVIWEEK